MHKDPHIANIFSAEEEDCLGLEQMAAYQQGKLAGQEMHLVERHLLNCELCAMTYESLAENTPESIAAGAAEVSDRAWERIQQREQRKRRGAIFWIASAASIILLVTVGYFTMRGPTGPEMDKTVAEAIKNTPPLVVPGPDSNASLAMAETPQESEEELSGGVKNVDSEEIDAAFSKENAVAMEDVPQPEPKPVVATSKTMEKPKLNLEDAYGGKDAIKSGKDAIKSDNRDFYRAPVTTAAPTTGKAAPSPKSAAKEVLNPSKSPNGASNVGGIATGGGPNKKEGAERNANEALDDFAWDGESDDAVAGDEVRTTDIVTLSEVKSLEKQQDFNSAGNRRESEKGGKMKNSKAAPSRAVTTEESATMMDVQTAPAVDRSFDQGLISYKEGNYREAAKDLRKATERTPSNLEAHIYAADAFLRIAQPQAALFHIDRILAVPGNSHIEDAEWYKALAFLQLKEGSKAKKQLEIVIARGGKYKTQAETALKELK